MAIHWIFLLLVLWTVPCTSLLCYQCYCPSTNITACDCAVTVSVAQGSHCTIVEDLHSADPYVELSTAPLDSSYVYIKDPYYVLLDESISYNETTVSWETKTKRVVHGCDWDLCNKYSLVASLPASFKLTIDDAWLTTNIYGTGSVTGCNVCPNATCGNTTSPIDYGLCPLTACVNSTTCSLYDLWHNVETEELCYQSQCTPPLLEDEFSDAYEKYKVQVEAIVYLAQNRSNFEIWQLDVVCAAENCSRPSIFQEIKEQLKGEVDNLINFPTTRPTTTAPPSTTASPPANPLSCYNCSCIGTVCPCTTYEISSADNTYCTIIRYNYGQFITVDYTHVDVNSTYVYIREYPYVLVEESIIYNEGSGRWNTRPDIVVYGCNWNLCNDPGLLLYLPNSFQMRLPESWLNSSILGTGQPIRDCHECPEAPQCGTTEFLDVGRCPIKSCNTTCLVSDSFNDPAKDEQCYQSFCAPPDEEGFEIDKHRVEIEGIIYASQPTTVELWEIDLYCQADDCSNPEIFKELRNNLIIQSGDITVLFNQTGSERKLRCFDCMCEGEQDCTCDVVSVENARTSYCAITRTYDGENVRIFFGHLDISNSYANVRELPYVIAKESILYNNDTGKWYTRTNEIVYGCNWDYCNKPSLLSSLPTSLEMTLPDSWLNSSLIGTGQPVDDCHECPSSSICTSDNTVDSSLCPVQACNTTCYVSNTYTNPESNEQCYSSYCVPEDSEELSYDQYRIEIQGIIYPSRPTNVELWEVYIYCRVDNCSRPEIFQEIKQELVVKQGNLSSLFNNTSVGEPGKLHCYDCYCVDDPICACNKTLALPDDETYCTVIREYDGQNIWITLEHIDRNSTRIYIREFPYMFVEESILYNEASGMWVTRPNLILYACNTDFCNDPRLVPSLPTDFRMRLPDEWLNTNVLGNGDPVRDCHECPETPQCGPTDFLDAGRCPIKSCNTTCLVSDVYSDPETDEQCYQSFCAPPDSSEFQVDRHRVEIAGIIYGNRPNAQVEVWEVDIFCRADDCSRPEIFKELRAQLTVYTGDLSAFFNMTYIPTTTTTPIPPVEPPLACYECACYDDPNCSCNTIQISGAYSSYCTIIRVNYGTHFTIDLEHIDRNSTRVYIRKFPYLLAEESILYDEATQTWSTRSNILVYGCNWDLCNHPSLVTLVPDSFKMTVSDEWLNKYVLDNGTLMRDCHECPEAPQCGTTDFLDIGRCPIKACNTTCVVSDTFNNPSDNLLCYQSYCSSSADDFEENRHRVELEGIIYGDQPNTVELWEIDIYCRADDCSRPEIFNDLRNNITTVTNNLADIFNNSVKPIEPQLICYNCFCYDDPNCVCNTFSTADAKDSYCVIIRDNFGEDYAINLEHIDRNSTRVYIRTFPYLLVEESIIYSDNTSQWNTRTNVVVYGCNQSYCNHPKYIPYLPDGFQMRLSDAWLNTNVLGTGQSIRDCHECPEGPQCGPTDFLDAGRCPVKPCNTTCLVSDLYSDPATDEQCYQSFCAPPDSEFFTIDPHRVEMEGILYLDYIGRPVELWEIDIFCRADDCSRPEIFNEIRQQFTVTLGNISIFYSNMTTVTPGSTTTPRSTSTIRMNSTSAAGSTLTSSPTTSTRTGTTPSPTGSTSSGSTGSSSGTNTASPGQTTSRSPVTTPAPPSSASICMAHSILILFLFGIARINFY